MSEGPTTSLSRRLAAQRLAASYLAYVTLGSAMLPGRLCPTYLLFRVNCPLCGLTRGCRHALHGRLRAASSDHWAAVPVTVALLVLSVNWASRVVSSRPRPRRLGAALLGHSRCLCASWSVCQWWAKAAKAELGERDDGVGGVEAKAASDDRADLLIGGLAESVGDAVSQSGVR